MKHIALFGGSFNPPHEGHREIVRRLSRRRTIDEVWVLPVWRHPFGKRLAPFPERLRLCREHLGSVSKKVGVKDLERCLGGVSWTLRLVRTLKKRHPRWSFSLVLGADSYKARREWRQFPAIAREVRIIVFPRGPRSPIPDVSSTEIRRRHSPRFDTTFSRGAR